jgi:hypothetical protein
LFKCTAESSFLFFHKKHCEEQFCTVDKFRFPEGAQHVDFGIEGPSNTFLEPKQTREIIVQKFDAVDQVLSLDYKH